MNPIELAFSKLKAHLRKAGKRTVPELEAEITSCLATPSKNAATTSNKPAINYDSEKRFNKQQRDQVGVFSLSREPRSSNSVDQPSGDGRGEGNDVKIDRPRAGIFSLAAIRWKVNDTDRVGSIHQERSVYFRFAM